MELPALHLQRHAREHGVVQGALRLGFWKGSLVLDDTSRSQDAMGQMGRVASLADLPPKATLIKWTKKAAALNDAGVTVKRTPKAPTAPLKVPPDLAAALKKASRARAVFHAFPPSKQRDYVEWLTEAKSDATRQKRLATAIEWLSEGKSRNWKYEK